MQNKMQDQKQLVMSWTAAGGARVGQSVMTFEEAFSMKLRDAEAGQEDRPRPPESCSEELRLRSQACLARWQCIATLTAPSIAVISPTFFTSNVMGRRCGESLIA
jgi:hypothetical protein